MKVSDCCYAPVKWSDICSACGEHCTPVQEGMSTNEAAALLVCALKKRGITFIEQKSAQNTDSIYLIPEVPEIGTVTVRTHPTKARHRIRWNLVETYRGKRERLHKGTRRFFFSFDEITQMADAIDEYRNNINQNQGGNTNETTDSIHH